MRKRLLIIAIAASLPYLGILIVGGSYRLKMSRELEEKVVQFDEGWTMRWGDSPVDSSGVPLWSLSASDSDWQAVRLTSKPLFKQDDFLWLRHEMPVVRSDRSLLLITGVLQSLQVYWQGDLLYSSAELPGPVKKTDLLKWHVVHLPEEVSGGMMTFRIYSRH